MSKLWKNKEYIMIIGQPYDCTLGLCPSREAYRWMIKMFQAFFLLIMSDCMISHHSSVDLT